MRSARRSLLGVVAVGALTAAMALGAGTASASDAATCTDATSSTAALVCPQQVAVVPEAGATTPETGTTSQGGTTVAPQPVPKTITRAPALALQQPAAAVAANPAAANPAAASAGTYTNSSGNQVESPDSNPVGATAICNDGKYSHSQNRSGTCSSNGGVRQFLTGGTTATPQASSSTSNGYQFNGSYWDDGQGHHKYGWGWNKSRHCWQYAAPPHVTAVTVTQVSAVPTGGVDTGDGSYGP